MGFEPTTLSLEVAQPPPSTHARAGIPRFSPFERRPASACADGQCYTLRHTLPVAHRSGVAERDHAKRTPDSPQVRARPRAAQELPIRDLERRVSARPTPAAWRAAIAGIPRATGPRQRCALRSPNTVDGAAMLRMVVVRGGH